MICHVVTTYMSALRDAWSRGIQPGHDDDSVLSRVEEEREVLEPWTADDRCVYCGATREYIDLTGGCVGPLCPNASRTGHPPSGGAGVAVVGSPTLSGGGHPKLSCPYCSGDLCCAVAADDVSFYRWEHGLI